MTLDVTGPTPDTETETETEAEADYDGLAQLFGNPQFAVIPKRKGDMWTHQPSGLVLAIPEVQTSSNWSLHADAIWNASIFLAEHLHLLRDLHSDSTSKILELGCGGGLLGLAIAKNYPRSHITLSDYPDEGIISTLVQNVERNKVAGNASVRPLDWNNPSTLQGGTFDIVVAADTLWASELHKPFCQTISTSLKREPQAKAHIVAGLHTGRFALQRFMDTAQSLSLDIIELIEYQYADGQARAWKVEREGETSEDMAQWLVYITLKHRMNA